MRLHINSEVDPWPYGHLELNKVVVKPCELSVFCFDHKKYKLFEEYKGELYGITVIYYDYDHPAIPGEGADPNKKYPSLLQEKYLWYSNDPVDKTLPKSKRYVHQIKLLQFEIKQFFDRSSIPEFRETMTGWTTVALSHCQQIP